MPIQFPAPVNQINLAAIDSAVQNKEWNALRMEGEQQRQGIVSKQQKLVDEETMLKHSLGLAKVASEGLASDPEWYFKNHQNVVQKITELGLDASSVPPATTTPKEAMKGFAEMGSQVQTRLEALIGGENPTTYTQPVAGVNPETGQEEFYRPDSAGGMNPTGIAPVAKQPLVSISNEAEEAGLTEEQKALASQRVAEYGEIKKSATAAIGTMETIDQMRNIDLSGGPGTDVKNQARRFIMALGGSALVNVDEVVNAASFTGLAYREFLNIMSTQKGPQTDNDFLRIKQTFATVTDPELAREFLMNSAYATASRKQEMAQFYSNYLEENNGTLKGADRAWDTYKRTTPLLSSSIKDPETGLPTFFIDFQERMRMANPGATDEQIVKKWRELTQGK